MVQYYYDKYAVSWKESTQWAYVKTVEVEYISTSEIRRFYKKYTYDKNTNSFTVLNRVFAPQEFPGSTLLYKTMYQDGNGNGGNVDVLQTDRLWRIYFEAWNHNDFDAYGYSRYTVHERKATQSVPEKGDLLDSGIVAENGAYPDNGIHTDGYWYVKTISVNNAPSIPGPITNPASGTTLVQGQTYNFQWGASTDLDNDALTYYPEYRVNGGSWTVLSGDAALNRNITMPMNAVSLDFRVRAFDGLAYSPYQISSTYTVVLPNAIPTITLNTANDQVLYENNPFVISGNAADTDSGDTVVVKYKINSGNSENIDAKVSDGSTPLNFSKSLTFKQGKLFDGTKAVTGTLESGTTHTLTVWVEDDRGGKSANVTRTFTVVPNRAPGLTVDTFSTVSNQINFDTITITGAVTDPEGEAVTVTYSLNGGEPVGIHNGAPGNWSIPLKVKALKPGDNKLVIEATDNFGAKTIRTINKLTKTPNSVPLKNSTAMWKVNPPTGTAKEVLAWIQREIGDLVVDASISMTNGGEPENFVPLTLSESAPIDSEITEDEFHIMDVEAKSNIILKLDLSRTDVSSDKSIKMVSGVLD